MHHTSMNIVPLCLLAHCVFNIWAYGADDVFPLKITQLYNDAIQSYYYYINPYELGDRIISSMGSPFLALLLLGFLVWLLDILVLSIIRYIEQKYNIYVQSDSGAQDDLKNI